MSENSERSDWGALIDELRCFKVENGNCLVELGLDLGFRGLGVWSAG